MTMAVLCDYCARPARLVGGDVIYPHRPDLAGKRFWHCAPCGAYVGCHPPGHGRDGTQPLGRLANAELRKAKQAAHAAFDPLWQNQGIRRRDAYKWLAETLRIRRQECHIGMFDVEQCRAVITAVEERADELRPCLRGGAFASPGHDRKEVGIPSPHPL